MSENSKRLLLLATALFVGLLLAEVILRLFVEQETKRLAAYDEELGWTGRPGGEGIYVRRRDGIRCRFVYNGYGFRDEELPVNRPDGASVLFLGDSFLEGLEVNFEETFQDMVEERLKGIRGANTEVVCIASQGYSTAQQLWAYRKFESIIQPGMVLLLFYTGNDLTDNLRRDFAYLDDQGRLVLPDRSEGWLRVQYLKFARWVYETSHLFFFVKNSIENLTSIRLADESKKASEASETYKMAITDSLMAGLRNDIIRDGRSFSVVIIPSAREIEADDDHTANRIVETCSRLGISSINLFPLLSRENYFQFDEHLNSSGHRVVADTLLGFIVDAGAVGPISSN